MNISVLRHTLVYKQVFTEIHCLGWLLALNISSALLVLSAAQYHSVFTVTDAYVGCCCGFSSVLSSFCLFFFLSAGDFQLN